jgi:hypothetical protein
MPDYLLPLLAVGGLMTMLALGLSVWSVRNGQRADQRIDLGSADLRQEVSDLRRELATAAKISADLRQELSGVRSALDTANIEIGRLRAALDISNVELGRLRATMSGSETLLKRPIKPLLLAQCEPAFGDVDAQAIRRTGILLQRLRQCKGDDLDRALQTGREDGQTVWWLQISAHMGDTGIKFADGIKSVEWLSQRIRGVQVLFLAGCENEEIGAQLVGANMAQHVIAMTEPVESRNAADFTFAFWRAVSEGGSVPDAYEQALQICPQISEMVMLRSARRK